MRLRFTVLALLSSALVLVSLPASSLALRFHHPHKNHGLTIDATPNPVISGEAVLIYGQLNGPDPGNQWVYLYHRVNPAPGYSFIGRTKTNAQGFYEFTRVEGVVTTNREWFARAPEYPGVHSRTVHEKVAALVSLAATPPASSAPTTTVAGDYDTGQPIQFYGHVTPNHAGERVVLQEQGSNSGAVWHTLKAGRLGGASNYDITYRFRTPGAYTLRTVFRGDDRNIGAPSSPISVTVQQKENPSFTISSSAPVIQYGSTANITGTLYNTNSATTPDSGVSVTLWGRTAAEGWHTVGLPTTTGPDGGYSFTVDPANNTVYKVRTTFHPNRVTALLFEGVQDVLAPNPVPPTAVVGQHITFTGSVSPDKAGSVIYLERFGADGYWHIVEVSVVKPNSTYQFGWTFGNTGAKEFRELIPGDPANIGAATAEQTITVSLPPESSLPANPSPAPIVNP